MHSSPRFKINRHRRQRDTLAPRRGVARAPAFNGRGGALPMSLYRCRYLDRTFNVFEIQGVACENDAEAIVMARRMSANTGAAVFELLQDERRVHMETMPLATARDHRSRRVAHGGFEHAPDGAQLGY